MARLKNGTYRLRARGNVSRRTVFLKLKPTGIVSLPVALAVIVCFFPSTPDPPVADAPTADRRSKLPIIETASISEPLDQSIVNSNEVTVSGTFQSNDPKRTSFDIFVGDQSRSATLDGEKFTAIFDELNPGVKTISTELDAKNTTPRSILIPRLRLDFDHSDEAWTLKSGSSIPFTMTNEALNNGESNFLSGTPNKKETDVIILSDKSISMKRTLFLPRLKKEIGLNLPNAIKAKLGPKTRFRTILFSDAADGTLQRKNLPPGSDNNSFTESTKEVYEQYNNFYSVGKNFTSSGSKPEHIYEALCEVMEELKTLDPNNKRQKLIVLVTDSYSLRETKSLKDVAKLSTKLAIPCFPIFLHYLKGHEFNFDDSADFHWDTLDDEEFQEARTDIFDAEAFEEKNKDELRGMSGEDWDKGTQLGILECKRIAKMTGGFFYHHAEQAYLEDAAQSQTDYLDSTARLISTSMAAGIEKWHRKQASYAWVASDTTVEHLRNGRGEFLEFSLLNCKSASIELASESMSIFIDLESNSDWCRHRVQLQADKWKTNGGSATPIQFNEVLSNLKQMKIRFRMNNLVSKVGLDDLMIADTFSKKLKTIEN